ncbi:MAG: heparan-alpha-glucosaminide N-acetyltransferase domain-containing protein [Candidatus Hodarchaeota archaeon]
MRQITSNRVHSVDTIRGIAIWFMIFVHYGQSWMNFDSLLIVYTFFLLPSYIGGPMFMVIVGVSFSLSSKKRKGQADFKTHVYKRAFLLILMQFFLNLVIFNIYQAWTYEVLILVGIAQIVCYLLMEKSNMVKILVISIIIIVVPFLREICGYQYEIYTLFESVWDFGTFFKSMVVNMPFAIFPYVSYMILGMMIGDELVQARYEAVKERKFCKNLVIYGCVLILIGFGPRIFNSPIVDSYEEGLHVLVTTGIVMIMLSGLYWLEDVKGFALFQPFWLYGQIALTFLIGHHFINKYIFYYLFEIMKNLSIYSYLILVTFICVVFLALSYFWSIIDYKFSLDWLIRKLS